MTTLTIKEIQKMEEYYYWMGFKNWIPFPKELNDKLLEVYGEEPVLIAGLSKIFMKDLER